MSISAPPTRLSWWKADTARVNILHVPAWNKLKRSPWIRSEVSLLPALSVHMHRGGLIVNGTSLEAIGGTPGASKDVYSGVTDSSGMTVGMLSMQPPGGGESI